MTPTEFRRASCIAVMVFSGAFMGVIGDYVLDPQTNLNELSTPAGVLLGSMFAALVALFRFAFDAFDGKIDDKS